MTPIHLLLLLPFIKMGMVLLNMSGDVPSVNDISQGLSADLSGTMKMFGSYRVLSAAWHFSNVFFYRMFLIYLICYKHSSVSYCPRPDLSASSILYVLTPRQFDGGLCNANTRHTS